jgi:hypothetical protein
MALCPRLAVHPDGSVAKELLRERARADLRAAGEKLVETNAGIGAGDGEANRRQTEV